MNGGTDERLLTVDESGKIIIIKKKNDRIVCKEIKWSYKKKGVCEEIVDEKVERIGKKNNDKWKEKWRSVWKSIGKEEHNRAWRNI